MRTKDVLRWNLSPRDMFLYACRIVVAGTMVALDLVVESLEHWLDRNNQMDEEMSKDSYKQVQVEINKFLDSFAGQTFSKSDHELHFDVERGVRDILRKFAIKNADNLPINVWLDDDMIHLRIGAFKGKN